MQILVISGSRNRQGKTALAINTVLKGATRAGGSAETHFLPEMKIERCRQCNPDGWGICRSEGRCIIEDDFASLVEKIKKADLVFFANPVYFGDLCESLRAFLDRYRRTRFRRPAAGQSAPPASPMMAGAGGIPAVGMCYAGGSGNGTITAVGSLERILQTGGFDIVDMIPVRRQNLDMKLPYLERLGEWMVSKPSSGPWPPPPAPASR